MKRQIALTALTGLMVAGLAEATIRVRVSDPEKFDIPELCADAPAPRPNQCFAEKVKNQVSWWTRMEEGAWDGGNATTGFDNATSAKGPTPTGSVITNQFWVDSLSWNYYIPLIRNSPDSIRDFGTVVGFYGYLRVDPAIAGDVTLYWVTKNSPPTYLWLDLNKDGNLALTNDTTNKELVFHNLTGSSTENFPGKPTADQDFGPSDQVNRSGYRIKTFPMEAGLYKFRAMMWGRDLEAVTHLMWKHKGTNGLAVDVPASAFGTRKNMGPAAPTVTDINKVMLEGKDITKDAFVMIDGCKPITYTAQVRNPQNKPIANYTWTVQGAAPITTNSPTLTVTFKEGVYPASYVLARANPAATWYDTSKNSGPGIIQVSNCASETALPISGSFAKMGIEWTGKAMMVPTTLGTGLRAEIINSQGRAIALQGRSEGARLVYSVQEPSLPRGAYRIRLFRNGSLLSQGSFVKL